MGEEVIPVRFNFYRRKSADDASCSFSLPSTPEPLGVFLIIILERLALFVKQKKRFE